MLSPLPLWPLGCCIAGRQTKAPGIIPHNWVICCLYCMKRQSSVSGNDMNFSFLQPKYLSSLSAFHFRDGNPTLIRSWICCGQKRRPGILSAEEANLHIHSKLQNNLKHQKNKKKSSKAPFQGATDTNHFTRPHETSQAKGCEDSHIALLRLVRSRICRDVRQVVWTRLFHACRTTMSTIVNGTCALGGALCVTVAKLEHDANAWHDVSLSMASTLNGTAGSATAQREQAY